MELKRWPSFLALSFMFSFRAFALAQELNDKPDVPSLDSQSNIGAIVSDDVKDDDDKLTNGPSPPTISLDELLRDQLFLQRGTPGGGNSYDPSANSLDLPKFMIGVSLTNVPASLRAHIDIKEGQGIMVGTVVPDSPAAKAGLQQYDILMKVADTDLMDPKKLQALFDAAGEKPVSVTFQRRGELKTVDITPVKREAIKRADNPYSLQLLPGGYVVPDHGNMSIKLPDGRRVQLAYPEQADQAKLVAPPPVNQIDSLTQSIQSLTQQMERLQQAIDRLEQKSEAPSVNPPDEKSGDAQQ